MTDLKVVEGGIDMSAMEAEVDAKIAEEFKAQAMETLVSKRREISRARLVLANLEREYEQLKLELSERSL